MAKLYASEIAVRAAEDCVQIHGGYGFVKDYPAEKFFRDVKLTHDRRGHERDSAPRHRAPAPRGHVTRPDAGRTRARRRLRARSPARSRSSRTKRPAAATLVRASSAHRPGLPDRRHRSAGRGQEHARRSADRRDRAERGSDGRHRRGRPDEPVHRRRDPRRSRPHAGARRRPRRLHPQHGDARPSRRARARHGRRRARPRRRRQGHRASSKRSASARTKSTSSARPTCRSSSLVPGTGDDVQALKAGIMEIADIFVVNKADREGADRTAAGDRGDAGAAVVRRRARGGRPSSRPRRRRARACRSWSRRSAGSGRTPSDVGERRRARSEFRLRELLGTRFMAHVERRRARARRVRRTCWMRSPRGSSIRTRRPTSILGRASERGPAAPNGMRDAVSITSASPSSDSTRRWRSTAMRSGLEIDAPEEVSSQRVRAHFIPAGESALELLEATAPTTRRSRSTSSKRGPGLHHITLARRRHRCGAGRAESARRAPDRRAAAPGREGALVAFVHPSSAHGVLVELKQAARVAVRSALTFGDLELIPLSTGSSGSTAARCSASCRSRSGSSARRPTTATGSRSACGRSLVRGRADDAHRRRHAATRWTPKSADIYGFDRTRHLDHALADAGRRRRRHRHRAGDAPALRPRRRVHARDSRRRHASARFPARGTSSDAASGRMRRTRTSGTGRATSRRTSCRSRPECCDLVEEDATVMPGVTRPPHRRAHDAPPDRADRVAAASTAVFMADLVPTTAHVPMPWIMGYDLYPMDTLEFKRAFLARSHRARVPGVLRARSGSRRATSARRTGSGTWSPVGGTAASGCGDGLDGADHRSASSAAAGCTTWPS